MTAISRFLTVALMVMAPAAAASENARQNSDSGYLYFRESGSGTTLTTRGPGGLTPSLLDNKQSARSVVAPLNSSAKAKAKTTERTFLFTPSGKVNDRKALSVGVTTRSLNIVDKDLAKAASTANAVNAIDVSGYNVGLAVGYKGFSVEAGYSRVEDTRPLSSNAEGVDVGLSYRGKDWKTTLQVAGEKYDTDKPSAALTGVDKSYSVELGGAYLLTPRLSLTGGVKYQVLTPGSELRSRDGDQASGSVYVGTNFKF